MDAAVWGFIGVVAGGALTLVGQWLRNRSDASIDSAKRDDDRQIERERAERETLSGLQDATSQMLMDIGHFRAQRPNTPERSAAAGKYAATGLLLRTLASRTVDTTARDLAQSFLNTLQEASNPDPDALDAALSAAVVLIDHTGPLIRATYREPRLRRGWTDRLRRFRPL